VVSLKQKIEAVNATLAAASLVTIYQGKVLADGTTLAEAGVTEAGFVVVMAKKTAGAPRTAAGRRHALLPPRRG